MQVSSISSSASLPLAHQTATDGKVDGKIGLIPPTSSSTSLLGIADSIGGNGKIGLGPSANGLGDVVDIVA